MKIGTLILATLGLLLSLGVSIGRAQSPGTVDVSFNAADACGSTGMVGSGWVSAMVRLANGKYIRCIEYTSFGQPLGQIDRLNADGTMDATYSSVLTESGVVRTFVEQPDGKVLIGGDFTTVSGFSRNRIARLNSNGGHDATFNPGSGFNGLVNAIALRANGDVFVGGAFTQVNGIIQNRITQLTANGTVMSAFDDFLPNGANGEVHAIVVQPNDQLIIAGDFTSVGGTACSRIARLTPYFTFSYLIDAAFNQSPGFDGRVSALRLQPDGKVVAGGEFTSFSGTTRNKIARLTSTGTLDATFTPGSGFNGAVTALGLRSDGQVAVGGAFTTSNGNGLALLSSTGATSMVFDPGTGPDGTIRSITVLATNEWVIAGAFSTVAGAVTFGRARLSATGTLDVSWSACGFNGSISALSVMPDGKVMVAGLFSAYFGTPRNSIIRLNMDGTLDPSFDPGVGPAGALTDGYRDHTCIIRQPDGRMLLGGIMNTYSGLARNGIVRMEPDGTPDTSFDAQLPAQAYVKTAVLQQDGRVLIGGAFSGSIRRVMSDGSPDNTFLMGTGFGPNLSAVQCMVLQPDGRILVGGTFGSYNGTATLKLIRLNTNGTLDGTFTSAVPGNPAVFALSLQPNGSVLVNGTHRLHANGTLDPTFNTGSGFNGSTRSTLLQPDGKIIVTGNFTTFNGTAGVNRIVRLNVDGSIDGTFLSGTGANGPVNCSAFDLSGGVMIGGSFTSIAGTSRTCIARINNTNTAALHVNAKVMLEGPFDPLLGMMQDSLRSQQLIPLSEPYSSLGVDMPPTNTDQAIPAGVFDVTGPNAIVDWVLVEIRSALLPAQILQAQAALLQRDGDIVSVDGVSPLLFQNIPGNYHIAIRHRNHLGVMTASPITLSTSSVSIDLTLPGTATYGTDARKNVNGVMLLWAGDVNPDGMIKYTGSANDRDPILLAIGGGTPTLAATGYLAADVTLDGVVKYTGSGNDRDRILVNIGGSSPTAFRPQQLP
jgi:uncharacterized delta-60 repeat protein